jgi:steroid delta-isomerase-like uncharacterized protein
LSDDVVHDINQGAREIGRARFAEFLARMNRAYREQLIDITVMADASGRRFAAEFIVFGSYLFAEAGLPPAHGQSYRLPVGAFFEVEAGLIRRITNYYNANDWLRQVGGAA